jgi:hypothetical protein
MGVFKVTQLIDEWKISDTYTIMQSQIHLASTVMANGTCMRQNSVYRY